MKKIYVVLLALTLLVTPYAQAKTCFGISCNYIDAATNSGFEQSPPDNYWGQSGGVSFPSATCNGYSSTVAQMDNTEWVSRTFYVDNTYSSFKVQLRAYLPGDNNNFYDELRIRVTNDDTGYSELHTLNGSSYTSHCGYNNFNLSGNYSNSWVTVRISSGNFSLLDWQIDDVGFFAYY
jgi:hypothetical protein